MGTLFILANSCLDIPNFGINLVQDSGYVKPSHMSSGSGIIRIAAVSLCSYLPPRTTILFVLQLIPCLIFHFFPNVTSPLFPEKRIQPLREHNLHHMSLFCDIECLHALNFTCCCLPDSSQTTCSPHLKTCLSQSPLPMQFFLLDFPKIRNLLSHSVSEIPSANLNILPPKYSGPTGQT